MNRREKILALSTASIMAGLLLYGATYQFLLEPGRQRARQAQNLRQERSDLESQNRLLKRCVAEFSGLRDRTFAGNPRSAGVLVGARINQLAAAAGLGEGDYTVSSFSDRRLNDAGRELACTITAKTSLERMVNFLYVLGRDEHLHRATHLTINPQTDKRQVSFTLRYATPVLEDPELADNPPRRATTQPVAVASLNDPGRAVYDVIARRHVLLPYVRIVRQEQPPQPTPVVQQETPIQQPQPPWYEQMIVVGLPALGEESEVHVAMPGGNVQKPLKVGDRLHVGQIAMVDYRLLILPANPNDPSPSRVILKIGRDYWAVELGQSLGQRRLLRAHELPDELKPKPAPPRPATSRPAAKASPASVGGEEAAGMDTK